VAFGYLLSIVSEREREAVKGSFSLSKLS